MSIKIIKNANTYTIRKGYELNSPSNIANINVINSGTKQSVWQKYGTVSLTNNSGGKTSVSMVFDKSSNINSSSSGSYPRYYGDYCDINAETILNDVGYKATQNIKIDSTDYILDFVPEAQTQSIPQHRTWAPLRMTINPIIYYGKTVIEAKNLSGTISRNINGIITSCDYQCNIQIYDKNNNRLGSSSVELQEGEKYSIFISMSLTDNNYGAAITDLTNLYDWVVDDPDYGILCDERSPLGGSKNFSFTMGKEITTIQMYIWIIEK